MHVLLSLLFLRWFLKKGYATYVMYERDKKLKLKILWSQYVLKGFLS